MWGWLGEYIFGTHRAKEAPNERRVNKDGKGVREVKKRMTLIKDDLKQFNEYLSQYHAMQEPMQESQFYKVHKLFIKFHNIKLVKNQTATSACEGQHVCINYDSCPLFVG